MAVLLWRDTWKEMDVFISTDEFVDAIAKYDVQEGRSEIQRALREAPSEATHWSFRTHWGEPIAYEGFVAINYWIRPDDNNN